MYKTICISVCAKAYNLTVTSAENVNSFELKLFQALFQKQYMEAARLLKQKINGGYENKILPEKNRDIVNIKESKMHEMKSQPISDKLFWSKFSKMVRRIN